MSFKQQQNRDPDWGEKSVHCILLDVTVTYFGYGMILFSVGKFVLRHPLWLQFWYLNGEENMYLCMQQLKILSIYSYS